MPRGGQKGNTKKVGNLNAKYRIVPANVRRVLHRPYAKPPRLYMITTAGVFICNPATFDKKKLLKRGYRRVIMNKCKTDFVYERTV